MKDWIRNQKLLFNVVRGVVVALMVACGAISFLTFMYALMEDVWWFIAFFLSTGATGVLAGAAVYFGEVAE